MSELNVYDHDFRPNEYGKFYLKSEADKVIAELKGYRDECERQFQVKVEEVSDLTDRIAEKDKEIARLNDRRLDVKDVAHILKAFKFYLCQLTHCAYDERTAQWIIDNWEQDYKRIEGMKWM